MSDKHHDLENQEFVPSNLSLLVLDLAIILHLLLDTYRVSRSLRLFPVPVPSNQDRGTEAEPSPRHPDPFLSSLNVQGFLQAY